MYIIYRIQPSNTAIFKGQSSLEHLYLAQMKKAEYLNILSIMAFEKCGS